MKTQTNKATKANKDAYSVLSEQLAQAHAENERLKQEVATKDARLSTVKTAQKEFSEYFVNSTREYIAYKNLSETKRYFEEYHAEVLKTLSSDNKITSKEFHRFLSSKM